MPALNGQIALAHEPEAELHLTGTYASGSYCMPPQVRSRFSEVALGILVCACTIATAHQPPVVQGTRPNEHSKSKNVMRTTLCRKGVSAMPEIFARQEHCILDTI